MRLSLSRTRALADSPRKRMTRWCSSNLAISIERSSYPTTDDLTASKCDYDGDDFDGINEDSDMQVDDDHLERRRRD